MSQSKSVAFMFGAAAGLVISAALIGFLLVGVAAVVDFRAGADSVLTDHPLFNSGKELIFTGLLAGSPLFAIWYLWRKRGVQL